MDGVADILNFQKTKLDYYAILNCSHSSSTEQILAEYRVKALQLHPDKNLDKPDCVDKFRQLQRAKDILCDKEKRKSYDKWLQSGITIDFERWLAMNANHSMHWAPKTVSAKLMVEEDNSNRVRSTTTSIDRDLTNRTADQGNPVLQSLWKSEDSSSSLLRKFRNYQI